MKELFALYQAIDEDNSYELYAYWDKLINFIVSNKEEALEYLNGPCSAEEYVIMSSVIDEVMEKTLDPRFTVAMRRLSEIYPEETKLYNIMSFIESAESFLE